MIDPSQNAKPMQKLLLISIVDREDYCIACGFTFPATSGSYKECIESWKDSISAPVVIDKIVEELCLVDDVFEGMDWSLEDVAWASHRLEISFRTSDGSIHYVPFQCDFIYIPQCTIITL